jgi:hypothetical protein
MLSRILRFALLATFLLFVTESLSIAAPQPKASGDGLQLSGFTWRIADGQVYVTIDGIRNDSKTRSTGWLRLRLFASLQMPSRNEPFSGYPVATFSILPPLDPGGRHYAQTFEAPLALTPPPGRYWMRLALYEWSPSLCAGNAWPEWCSNDDATADGKWIIPPGPDLLTAFNPGSVYCVENATAAVVEQLKASNPQVEWITRPSRDLTCESQGMTHYAGFLRNANQIGEVTPVVFTYDYYYSYQLCRYGMLADCIAAAPAGGAFTGQWWNAGESGWGISLSHASRSVIFAVWFAYDAKGAPKWYTGECTSFAFTCYGPLYETVGPPVGPTFNPALVSRREVGTLRIEFSGTQQARMYWTLDGVSGTRDITRQTY